MEILLILFSSFFFLIPTDSAPRLLTQVQNLITDLENEKQIIHRTLILESKKESKEHMEKARKKHKELYDRVVALMNTVYSLRGKGQQRLTLRQKIFIAKEELEWIYFDIYCVGDKDLMLAQTTKYFIELYEKSNCEWDAVRNKDGGETRKVKCIKCAVSLQGLCIGGTQFLHQNALPNKSFHIRTVNNGIIHATMDVISCSIICKANKIQRIESKDSIEYFFVSALDEHMFLFMAPKYNMIDPDDKPSSSFTKPSLNEYSATLKPEEAYHVAFAGISQNLDLSMSPYQFHHR